MMYQYVLCCVFPLCSPWFALVSLIFVVPVSPKKTSLHVRRPSPNLDKMMYPCVLCCAFPLFSHWFALVSLIVVVSVPPAFHLFSYVCECVCVCVCV